MIRRGQGCADERGVRRRRVRREGNAVILEGGSGMRSRE